MVRSCYQEPSNAVGLSLWTSSPYGRAFFMELVPQLSLCRFCCCGVSLMASIDVFNYVVALLFGLVSSLLTLKIEWNLLTKKNKVISFVTL